MREASFYIYKNLHRDAWSIQYKGIVIAHADELQVYAVRFKIWQPIQQKVRETGRKAVHAFVCTTMIDSALNLRLTNNYHTRGENSLYDVKALDEPLPILDHHVRYNPFETDFFMCQGEPIHRTRRLNMHQNSELTTKTYPTI